MLRDIQARSRGLKRVCHAAKLHIPSAAIRLEDKIGRGRKHTSRARLRKCATLHTIYIRWYRRGERSKETEGVVTKGDEGEERRKGLRTRRWRVAVGGACDSFVSLTRVQFQRNAPTARSDEPVRLPCAP